MSEWDTATQLGHRRPGVTERYTAYDPAYLRGAGDALERLVREVTAAHVPVWCQGNVRRGPREVARVGWYETEPAGMLRAKNAPVPETMPEAAE